MTEGGYDGLYLDIGQPANDNGHALGALVQRLRTAMPDKRLYVAADAPARGQTVPDYTALGKAADRLVLRLPAYTVSEAAVPVYAMGAAGDRLLCSQYPHSTGKRRKALAAADHGGPLP